MAIILSILEMARKIEGGWIRSIENLGASPFMRDLSMLHVTFTQRPSRRDVSLMSSSPAGTAFIGLYSFLRDVSFLIFVFLY
jgi:hypothetical protein